MLTQMMTDTNFLCEFFSKVICIKLFIVSTAADNTLEFLLKLFQIPCKHFKLLVLHKLLNF